MTRDKRTGSGARRYVRQIGDHYMLLGACCCRIRRRAGTSPEVCLSCKGAVLTRVERRDELWTKGG